jgi:hypothetical protein
MDLCEFRLAWRWTDPRYAVLPSDVLARIIPQRPARAARLWAESLRTCDASGLDARAFTVKELPTGDADPAAVSAWLRACHPDEETTVVLSWQPDLAVTTTWGIFVRYWNEFCYPASDDVHVWSEAHPWVLLYHHEELFQFGVPAVSGKVEGAGRD